MLVKRRAGLGASQFIRVRVRTCLCKVAHALLHEYSILNTAIDIIDVCDE